MPARVIWRSTIFILVLILLYFAFPILIVPSSLPAIKTIVIDDEYPSNYFSPYRESQTPSSVADAQIYQLTIPTVPTIIEKFQFLQFLHREGLKRLFPLNR